MNSNFVNVWVLNRDLRLHRDAKGIDGVSPLERAIISGWNKGSPVDCQMISKDLKLLMSLSLNDFMRKSGFSFYYKGGSLYRDALNDALTGTNRE